MIKQEVLRSFSGRNVLVTGGTGLIGREIVHILCDAGAHVKIVSLDKVEVDSRAAHVSAIVDWAMQGFDERHGFRFHVAG